MKLRYPITPGSRRPRTLAQPRHPVWGFDIGLPKTWAQAWSSETLETVTSANGNATGGPVTGNWVLIAPAANGTANGAGGPVPGTFTIPGGTAQGDPVTNQPTGGRWRPILLPEIEVTFGHYRQPAPLTSHWVLIQPTATGSASVRSGNINPVGLRHVRHRLVQPRARGARNLTPEQIKSFLEHA